MYRYYKEAYLRSMIAGADGDLPPPAPRLDPPPAPRLPDVPPLPPSELENEELDELEVYTRAHDAPVQLNQEYFDIIRGKAISKGISNYQRFHQVPCILTIPTANIRLAGQDFVCQTADVNNATLRTSLIHKARPHRNEWCILHKNNPNASIQSFYVLINIYTYAVEVGRNEYEYETAYKCITKITVIFPNSFLNSGFNNRPGIHHNIMWQNSVEGILKKMDSYNLGYVDFSATDENISTIMSSYEDLKIVESPRIDLRLQELSELLTLTNMNFELPTVRSITFT